MPHETTDQDLRQWLREGTAADHDRLDQLMGTCDLQTRDGMRHFLLAHAIGLAAVGPAVAGFMQGELGLTMPDPCAMVAQDLADLGLTLPIEAAALSGGGAGVAYVLLGSRMGVAALRKQGYWSPGAQDFSRYMEDRSLLTLWPPLLGWLRQADPSESEKAMALEAARSAFAAFEQGLEHATRLLALA